MFRHNVKKSHMGTLGNKPIKENPLNDANEALRTFGAAVLRQIHISK